MNIKSTPILAIVVPGYNEEEIIQETYKSLISVLNNLIVSNKISVNSYLAFVDDGSKDNTWNNILAVSKIDNRVKGIKLCHNVGHQKALLAGICENNADIYISIDCDLQDDINCIYDMVDKYLQKEVDVVYGVRNSREADGFFKRSTAGLYYKILGLFGVKCVPQHADFRLITDNVAKILRNVSSDNLYMRGFITSLGMKSDIVSYKRLERIGGKSKYTFLKSCKLALDGFIEFSPLPVFLMFIAAFISLLLAAVKSSLVFLGFSLNFFILGILSVYISRIYNSLKQKNVYVIAEKTNDN